jgi:intergrase/recombinase
MLAKMSVGRYAPTLNDEWIIHHDSFTKWLQYRDITKSTKRDYYNSLTRFFKNSTVSKPQDLRELLLKDKAERGLRNFMNYFEEEDIDEVAGYTIEKGRRFIKIKQSGVVEIYVTDDEIREALDACAVDIKPLLQLVIFSGNRLSHVHAMLETFDERNMVIDGEVAHYPTSAFSKGTKRTFQIFFPTSFIPVLNSIGKPYTYNHYMKKLRHGRVTAKTIRKWHLNLMISEGIPESIADFIQGRAPVTVGSAHYLNKVMQAKEAYSKLVKRFDNILE